MDDVASLIQLTTNGASCEPLYSWRGTSGTHNLTITLPPFEVAPQDTASLTISQIRFVHGYYVSDSLLRLLIHRRRSYSSSSEQVSKGRGLGTGGIIGITVGSCALLVCTIGWVLSLVYRRAPVPPDMDAEGVGNLHSGHSSSMTMVEPAPSTTSTVQRTFAGLDLVGEPIVYV